MQNLDNRMIFSASDITGFLACEHLTQLELRAAKGLIKRPHRKDPLVDLLAKKGLEHENRFRASLEAEGLKLLEIPQVDRSLEGLEKAAGRTEEAMREGWDVIYQAVLFDGPWRGYADFLRRVDRPSELGDFGFEVWDTKLARKPKAAAVLQLCSYSDHVARIQGVDPLEFHLVLGNQELQSYRLRDYVAYYRMIRDEFVAATTSLGDTYPDPVEHCRICRWRSGCNSRRRDDDHLSLVAEMRRDQIKKLSSSGTPTVEALAACDPSRRVKGIAPATFVKLQDQAAMQVEKRATNVVAFKLLEPPGPEKGLEALPAPSEGDLFFDIEADPYAGPEGLEFMFGFIDASDEVTYETWWAHDSIEEKVMFERFVDLLTKRLVRFPDMHVYHYAPYEIGALRRLMGRHGTREEELDSFLRRQVFVDLYQVVRQSMRISEESYSIKRLESFYMEKRDDRITEESSALVEYEMYLETGNDRILRDLEEYNRYDCISLYYLQRWLERRRGELESVVGHELSRPKVEEAEASETLTAARQEVQACVTALTQGLPEDGRSPEEHGRWLLSELLSWHRREAKSEWWSYFDREKKTSEELIDDSECLSGLSYEGVVGQVARSEIHKLTFPIQEHKIQPGDKYEDPDTRKGITVTEVNNDEHYVLIKKGKGRSDHPTAIFPGQPLDTKVQRQALLRFAKQVIAGGIEGDGPRKAARDLLLKRRPDVEGTVEGENIRNVGEVALDAAVARGTQAESFLLADTGTTGDRQDLHRRAHDHRPCGEGANGGNRGHQSQGHRQPARGGLRDCRGPGNCDQGAAEMP